MNIKEEFDKLLKMHAGGANDNIIIPVTVPSEVKELSEECVLKKEHLLFQHSKDLIEHLYELHHATITKKNG